MNINFIIKSFREFPLFFQLNFFKNMVLWFFFSFLRHFRIKSKRFSRLLLKYLGITFTQLLDAYLFSTLLLILFKLVYRIIYWGFFTILDAKYYSINNGDNNRNKI